MNTFPSDDSQRLSRIETHWSLIRRAHDDEDSHQVVDAKQQLLLRYAPAIRRYLGAALRDPEAADEVFQEFAVKFSRGDFRGADPKLGRFRQFVKTTLYRLIVDHHRQQKRNRRQSIELDAENVAATEDAIKAADETLLLAWRDELLNLAWTKLDEYSRQNSAAFHAALRMRVENPQWSSDVLAEHLSAALGKPMTPGSTRVLLHRARQRFAEVLLDALVDSLDSGGEAKDNGGDDNFDELEAEVVELRLLDYCREALAARKP